MILQERWSDTRRFVVGTVHNPEQAGNVVQELLQHNLPLASISILAKQPLLAESALSGALPVAEAAEIDLLASNRRKVICLGHGLGDILRMPSGDDRKTLKEILQRWLLPRHARTLSEIVEEDGILIWVEALCSEDEKTASLSLLRNSNGTVQIHDFGVDKVATP